MLGALAGGDAFEIIIALKDLSEAGFRRVEGNLAAVEAKANATNLTGFSKGAKAAEKDAVALAGKEAKGGGGIGGMIAGLLGVPAPVAVAVAAIGALTVTGIELTKTYDEIEKQEKALEIAAKDHGIALDDLTRHVDAAITANEQYGIGASDTREAILKLTEAGIPLADQQQAMGPIADLAKAKHLDLAEAARVYSLAVMGNTRAVKEFGIALPPVSVSAADLGKQQDKLAKAQEAVAKATDHLNTLTEKSSTTTKGHAASTQQLKDAQLKLADAQAALKKQQDAVTLAQEGGIDKGARLKLINEAITKAVGDQRNAVTPLDQAQARLGDAWQRLSTGVGPGLEKMFFGLVTGLGEILNKAMDVAGFIGPKLAPVFDLVGRAIGSFINTVKDAIGWLGNLLGKVGDVGKSIANSPIGQVAGGAAGFIGGLIPHFAAGGVVSGPTLAMIGEGGEREFVIPESKMGSMRGGGASVHHVHVHIDARELAYSLERPLGELLNNRGTGAMSFGGA